MSIQTDETLSSLRDRSKILLTPQKAGLVTPLSIVRQCLQMWCANQTVEKPMELFRVVPTTTALYLEGDAFQHAVSLFLGLPATGWEKILWEPCICPHAPTIDPYHGHVCTAAGNGTRLHHASVAIIASLVSSANTGVRVQIEPRALEAGYVDESARTGPDLKVTGFGTGNNVATLFDLTTVNPSAATYVKKFTNFTLVRAKETKPTLSASTTGKTVTSQRAWNTVAKGGKHSAKPKQKAHNSDQKGGTAAKVPALKTPQNPLVERFKKKANSADAVAAAAQNMGYQPIVMLKTGGVLASSMAQLKQLIPPNAAMDEYAQFRWDTPTYAVYARHFLLIGMAHTNYFEFKTTTRRVLLAKGMSTLHLDGFNARRYVHEDKVVFSDNLVWNALSVQSDLTSSEDPNESNQGGGFETVPDDPEDPWGIDSCSYLAEAPDATEISAGELAVEIAEMRAESRRIKQQQVVEKRRVAAETVSPRRARGDSPAGGDDVEDDTEDDSVDMDVVGASASGACTNIDPKAALFAKPLE